MRILITCLTILVSSLAPLYANIQVIAAENFYGNLAKTIGGKDVAVTSIISNPDNDPHLFSTSPTVMKQLTKAQVIIYNGVDYDPWMNQMLQSQSKRDLIVINVGELMGIKADANPHIWYNPNTFITLANKLTSTFSTIEPKNKDYFEQNKKSFLKDYDQVIQKINDLKSKTKNIPVTATEPVFGYMSDALEMDMKGLDVQWRIMNDTEPSPKMMANYYDLLNDKKVCILFFNNQVQEPATDKIKQLAEKNQIAIIGVSETMPKDDNITHWLLSILNQIDTVITYESNCN